MANDTKNDRRRRLFVVVGVVVAAVALIAVLMNMRRSVVPVRAETALRGPIMSAISTNGKVETIDNFEAHAPAPITVQKVLVQEGDRVRAGQLLVQLNNAEARAQVAKAQAQLKAAEAALESVKGGGSREEVLTNQSQITKAQVEREAAQRNLEVMRRLQQRGAASPQEVQAAENRLRAAESDLDLLKQKRTGRYSQSEVARVQAQADEARAALSAATALLRETDIRAPRAGTVYSLPVRQGQFVNAGDLIVAVANLAQVQVRAFVDEPDIGRLHPGQQVEVTWDAIPGRIWKGTLTRVPTNVTTRGTRNVGEITCVVDNSDRKLIPNVNVSALVITAIDNNALTLSREAVHQDERGAFVFQIVDGTLKHAPIQTGISNLTRIQVTKGISDEAVVALGTLSAQQLRDGLPVRVVQK
ncbi:MAG TPA: efflux RND transporter periplasmic adaptor subunit [Terriglobales bacterium]|nr:efflux RND transporter periplasmic adaptor subunit [Terriglobales bacterium]